jgi:quercetin dioxygenase-like cupin family protein
MEYERSRKPGRPSGTGPQTAFTGHVMMDPLLDDGGAGQISVNSVIFTPGARTFWHSHGAGQTLLVVSGRGLVQTRDGEARVLTAGDVVWAPPGEVHWHGAGPDTFLNHTAVSLGRASFGEEVDEEQYRNAFGGQ